VHAKQVTSREVIGLAIESNFMYLLLVFLYPVLVQKVILIFINF